MAIANLHETLMSYKLRRNALNLEITQLQNQKSLATYSQADAQSLKNAQDRANRSYFKQIYEADQADGGAHLYDDYKDYTEIPDFEEEVNKIIDEAFDKIKPTSMKDMKDLMAYINPLVKGKADMGYVSKSIKDRLN